MDWYYLLNRFDGRIGRQTFWIAMGAVVAVEILCDVISYQIEGERLTAIVDLAFTYPEFAIAAKRGHDRNMPPWVVGIFFGAGVLAGPAHRSRTGAARATNQMPPRSPSRCPLR